MQQIQMGQVKLLQNRLDGVHAVLTRVPYRSWAYTYWTGVYAYLLRRLNTHINDTNLREQINTAPSLH